MTAGCIGRESPRFMLAQARKPASRGYLSGVVLVADGEGKGYTYIKFADALVESVGRALPRGLSPFDKGYLKAVRVFGTDRWRMYGCYVDNSATVFLWEADSRPSWLGTVRR